MIEDFFSSGLKVNFKIMNSPKFEVIHLQSLKLSAFDGFFWIQGMVSLREKKLSRTELTFDW